ncbi:right-handed parallel beta-helix repeat-containing protein [Streptomyces sp. AJS327]|uniref:right-handed parallel beta-helix repeat-containing protein n=1 Tax=Streptomyces sp. AJS327 TaxID=2545265 RepID=UPI0015DD8FC7|nr:right-handed parallel beta-helix repeat-containing protein [Streptomyces sp. AJS327]
MATTAVLSEDSECIALAGNGSIASPLVAAPIISPRPGNLISCDDGLYASNGGTWTPQDFGAAGNGVADDAPALQLALNAALAAGGGTVYVPAGIYRLATLPLRIYRRTRLALTPGATMRRGVRGTMLLNGDAGQNFPGYSGHGDIVIEGGTWDARGTQFAEPSMCISIGHAENVLIRDLTIKDVGGYHGIEINSTRHCVIRNVRGLGYVDTDGRDFSEFIQPDLAKGSAYFGGFGPYDDTPVIDLLVEGCVTGASGTPGTTAWPRGIGSHSASPSRPHRDIRVRDCAFQGCSQFAIGAYTWESVVISGVQFRDCGGGIRFRTLDSSITSHRTPAGGSGPTITGSQPFAGLVVDNVTMTGGGSYGAAVELVGEETGYVQDVTVGRVTARNVGQQAVRMEYVEDYVASDIVAHTTGATSISTLGTRRGRFADCHVNGSGGAGITVDSRSTPAATGTDVQIVDCTVTGTAANGVHIWDGADLLVDSCELYALNGYGVQVSTNTARILVRDTRTSATTSTPINFTSTVTGAHREGNSADAPGTITTATAANTTTETVVASLLIPAADALPGTSYRFSVHGQASTTGTPTLTIRVRLGGPTGAVLSAFSAVTTSSGISGRGWSVNGALHAIAPGSSGTWAASAQLIHRLAATTGQTLQDVTDGTVTRDSTADQALVVTAQWSAASASNTAQALASSLNRV